MTRPQNLDRTDSRLTESLSNEPISGPEYPDTRAGHASGAGKPFAQKKRLRILWGCAVFFIGALLVVRPLVSDTTILHAVLQQIGLLMLLAGIAGRLWSIIYVGGRKNCQLVTLGPYSLTRNPLYLSSMVAIAGATLTYGSILLTILFTALLFLVFRYAARREAAYLGVVFGIQYTSYAASTPLFFPKLALPKTDVNSLFSPRIARTTARDATFLVALIPLIELVQQLHRHDLLPALAMVP